MLIDTVNEQRTGFVYPGGTSADDALNPLRQRLAKAGVFVLDRDAVSMSASVALSRPTSILSALPWVRLPFELTWIEFLSNDVRDALGDLGSPLIAAPGTVTKVERAGFLLRMEGDSLIMDYVHLDVATPQKKLVDLAPVQLTFRVKGNMPEIPPDIGGGRGGAEISKGRMREHLKLISTDPNESAAEEALRRRFSWTLHPDMTAVAAEVTKMMGEARVDQIQQLQATEAYRTFAMQILPALILLNCKNAVAVETVPAPEKLNKKREKSGRPPLVEHKIVKVSLSKSQKRRADASGEGTGRWVRGSLVMGHFKVRKTGIFWWSPHARRGYGALTRTHIITR